MSEQIANTLMPSESSLAKLKGIWASVLQKETTDLDINEHFLDLGGDSLAAMLCISRIRTDFGIDFAVEEFFMDHATLSDFAAIVDEQRNAQ